MEPIERPPVDPADVPMADPTQPSGRLGDVLARVERREILSALRRTNGHRTLTARALGISRSRLYRRVEALGIDLETAS
jgi:DNA-binding NtrC family response regulator